MKTTYLLRSLLALTLFWSASAQGNIPVPKLDGTKFIINCAREDQQCRTELKIDEEDSSLLIAEGGRRGDDSYSYAYSSITEIVFSGSRYGDEFDNQTDIQSVVRGKGGSDDIRGGSGDDDLDGGDGNDSIWGRGGNDRIKGGNGTDTLKGEGGNDIIYGQRGKDYIHGGYGNDRLEGGKGKDTLWGNHGDDTLKGGKDKDTCTGGAGNDDLNSCEKKH